METPLERRIRTYAFNHGCDMDEATYKVLSETIFALSNHKVDGLYDSLFEIEEEKMLKRIGTTPDGKAIFEDEKGNRFVGGYQPTEAPDKPIPPKGGPGYSEKKEQKDAERT